MTRDNADVNTFTPARIIQHLQRGWVLPADWRERLTESGIELPPLALFDSKETP